MKDGVVCDPSMPLFCCKSKLTIAPSHLKKQINIFHFLFTLQVQQETFALLSKNNSFSHKINEQHTGALFLSCRSVHITEWKILDYPFIK